MDRNAPLHTSRAKISGSGVPASSREHRAKVAADASEAKTRTGLNPNLRISGVVAGLMPMLPMKTAATMAPAWSGSQPKPSWNISGSRNGTALMVRRYANPPVEVARNVRVPKTFNWKSGLLVRRSHRTAAAMDTKPAATLIAPKGPEG
ncbi:hypothetical protein D9M72_426590 [compost metagenome]